MPRLDLSVIGSSGLKQYAGHLYEEFLPKLQGIRAIRKYDEMRNNSPIVGAMLYLIEALVGQTEWRFEPTDESDAAKEQAEFMDGCIEDMEQTWSEFIQEVITVVPFGWALHEEVYKRRSGLKADPRISSRFDDGRIGWRKLPLRAQETLHRWQIGKDGTILGMWQIALPTYSPVLIPMEKALLFRVKATKNNPEGRSMLRNSVRPYDFIKRMEEIEAIGIERDLAGLPVLEVPEELMSKNPPPNVAAMRAEFQDLIQSIRRDEREGVIVPTSVNEEGKPTGYKLSLLSTGGRRQIVTGQVVTRHETRMAMSVLAEFLMLGLDKVGTYSLASSKTHVFSVALGSLMDMIADVFNRKAIPDLMQLNNVPQGIWPYMMHGDIETPPLDEIGSFVLQMAQSGFDLTDEGTQRKLREMAGLPTEDLNNEEFVAPAAQTRPAVQPAPGEASEE